MIDPALLWPTALGCGFFVAGMIIRRREIDGASGFLGLAPVFVAASIAAFAGEHFTAARFLATMVPKWLPGRLFIAYFVGVAHTAAALSLVARRCVRWSSLFLGIMFALFVLLLHLPNAITNPGLRIAWIVTVRETTFALGALCLLAPELRGGSHTWSRIVASAARYWAALVIIFFGVLNARYPHLSPGVPDTQTTAAWVPFPVVLAWGTGVLLVTFGAIMFVHRYASAASAGAGWLMLILTLVLYVPQYFLAQTLADRVVGINFVFDTLLFSGTMLAIARAIRTWDPVHD